MPFAAEGSNPILLKNTRGAGTRSFNTSKAPRRSFRGCSFHCRGPRGRQHVRLQQTAGAQSQEPPAPANPRRQCLPFIASLVLGDLGFTPLLLREWVLPPPAPPGLESATNSTNNTKQLGTATWGCPWQFYEPKPKKWFNSFTAQPPPTRRRVSGAVALPSTPSDSASLPPG